MWFHATIVTVLLATAIALAAPVTVIDTDFGQSTVAVKDVSEDGAKSITGSVPEGWTENSGWNKEIVLSYEPQEEAGRKFLRVTKTSGGTGQLAFYMNDGIPQETFCHVELTARSSGKAGMTVGIRDAGPPYTFHWSLNPALTLQWQDFTYDFRLDAKPQRVGVWINLGGNGSYDVAHFKMVTKTREDIIAELKARHPESAAKNLVRVSRFPLGLPTGWSLDRDCSDGDDIGISPSTMAGPSGTTAMSISADDKWRLWTAPVFIGRSFEPHTASLYARGSGKLRLTAFGDGRQLQSKEFDLTPDQWERVSLTFTPLLLGQMHQLTIDGVSNAFLDGFQIERGSAATDYAPQKACEVELDLPDSAASAACIQFTDEPATIRYAVTGAPAGSVLKLKQFDLYGGEAALPDVKNPTVEGSVKLALPAARPLGTFRVEAHVENAQGETISPPDEVVLHRVRRPRYWQTLAPNSPFGVHTN
ncbi:MAG: hypothetical protein KKI08_01685, partial [Armatimonadetes bacterium]|nr:hypothetical protein [Armatimonadota bacterium]